MKAIVNTQYGSPDVLRMLEVAKPTPKENEVLIKIHAVAVNAADWHLLKADPFLVRLQFGLFKPKYTILGADIAGRVEAVGQNVKKLKVGDDVFGNSSSSGWGGYAEYAAVREDVLVLKPANITFEEAAAVPMAAVTALLGLKEGKIQQGQTVLINGASGGVGTFAIQIAKVLGAEVTAVCSTRNVELARSLGADHVIDYTQEDFTQNGRRYDLIFDAVGNRSVSDLQRALSPHGICAVVGFTSLSLMFQVIVLGAWVSKTGREKIGLMDTVKPGQKDLSFIKSLLEAGKVVPVIDRCYPLPETAEAIRYLEQGRARGKVVITVDGAKA